MFGQNRRYINPITAISDSNLRQSCDVHSGSSAYLTYVDRKLALVKETEVIPCRTLHYMLCKAIGNDQALDFVLFTQTSVQFTLGFVLLTQARVQLTHGFVILILTIILFTMGFVQYNEATNNYSRIYGESLHFLTFKQSII